MDVGAAESGGAPRPETVVEVLRAAELYLQGRGVDAPRRSAELLMGRVLGMQRLDLYLAHDRPIVEAERVRLRSLVAQRARGVPLAYVLGDWDFYGLTLSVGPDVLVPRPETEHLVELAIELAPEGARCVDLGTGSGAIAVALAHHRRDLRVVATDLCPRAAAIARRNAAEHGVADRVQVLEGDYWAAIPAGEAFDVCLANPPYVDPGRPDLLAPDVREHEPHLALFTEPSDPASAYRAIAAGLFERVVPGGRVLLETGVGAAEPALEVLQATEGLVDCELRNDLAGLPRYLVGVRSQALFCR